MRLDYVLALKIEDFLERRLQTCVYKLGLAKSIHHARVLGLRNKREVWRVQLTLSKIRRAARSLLTLDEKDPKRLFEGNALITSPA